MTTLPADFLWGAATAAHQIEGDNYNSDFWAAEHSGRAFHLEEPSGSACDSWHRYREDIRLLAEAGLTTYRFSIEWARIEPADGLFSRAALLHYRDMIDACHEHGVTPIITLHHFTYPQWFTAGGGSLRPDAPGAVRRVRRVRQRDPARRRVDRHHQRAQHPGAVRPGPTHAAASGGRGRGRRSRGPRRGQPHRRHGGHAHAAV